MAKSGEKTYFGAIGEDYALRTLNKPFVNQDGALLAQMSAVLSLLPHPPAKLLDLGCGTGWTSVIFARSGYDVIGQDISQEAITLAAKHELPKKIQLKFVASDYEGMKYAEEFDCAVFFDALHHAEDVVAALGSVHAALKPGGRLVVSEPGKGHGSSAEAQEAVERFGVTERDMPPTAIIAAAKQAGFSRWVVYPDLGLIHKAFFREQFSRPLLNRLRLSWLRLAMAGYVAARKRSLQGIVVLYK
jgi:2-polyprenyl-3-methyl-5-hydroxy-6-metoxy-1,4-benzoquinol methylase